MEIAVLERLSTNTRVRSYFEFFTADWENTLPSVYGIREGVGVNS
jgi:hypothetical protein